MIINSLFMKESNPSLEESILKIIARMEQDNSVMDQAALHLLFVTGNREILLELLANA